MMADSVEAASRSLKEHTEENIRALVDKIIDGQIADGLMRNAPLTFKDVETIKNVFVEKLKIMYHLSGFEERERLINSSNPAQASSSRSRTSSKPSAPL